MRNTHRLVACLIQNAAVDRGLLRHVGDRAAGEHGDFGTEQADPVGAGALELRQFQAEADIEHQLQRNAVGGGGRTPAPVRQFGEFGVAGLLRADVGLPHLGFRPQDELAFIRIDHGIVALFGTVQHATQTADGGDAQRAREDGGVAGGARFLDRHAGDPAGLPIQQLGRTKAPREQDRALGHGRARNFAGQRGQQAVGEVLHVGEAFAQIGVADPAHPVVQFAGDALHRGLGGRAAADDVADAAQPAGIGGHQPVRLQHFP